MNSGDVRPGDAKAFQRWLSASPAHKTAFNDAKRRWKELKPTAIELMRSIPEVAAIHERALRGPAYARWAFLGAAVSAAAVAGVAVLNPPLGLWSAPAEWGADYRTATGEQRAVMLGDRVSITLNTQTSIRRQAAGDGASGIDLLAGEAAIDLPEGGHPFQVAAGAGRSLAESGRFEVRFLGGKVCVTCIEGSVRVEHPAGSRLLRARQQTLYDGGPVGGVAGIEPAKRIGLAHGGTGVHQHPVGRRARRDQSLPARPCAADECRRGQHGGERQLFYRDAGRGAVAVAAYL